MTKTVIALATVLALAGCAEATVEPSPSKSANPEKSILTHYNNCDDVRAAGKAPLYKGDPGYNRDLDRDGDGVACS